MLSVVTWKWQAKPGYRSVFTARHVNVLRNMVERHLHMPHRFICATDDPVGIDPRVEVVPLWDEIAPLSRPNNKPNCYRRLRMFSSEVIPIFGNRILSLDLDSVIVKDMTPLASRKEDFIAWGDTAKNTFYNGSMMLLTPGARQRVWDEFDPRQSPGITALAGIVGSDQAWISHVLGPKEATWGEADGIYSFRNYFIRLGRTALPSNARAVFFHGKFDPWTPGVADNYPWVKENWR